MRIAHSTDGGNSFKYLGGKIQHINPSPAQTLHLDHCEMWINPINPNHLAVGNDGGFYHSYDKGQHWTHYNNIPSGEFYTITLERRPPYRIFGGTQDNATVFGQADEYFPSTADPWQYLWIDAWSGGRWRVSHRLTLTTAILYILVCRKVISGARIKMPIRRYQFVQNRIHPIPLNSSTILYRPISFHHIRVKHCIMQGTMFIKAVTGEKVGRKSVPIFLAPGQQVNLHWLPRLLPSLHCNQDTYI